MLMTSLQTQCRQAERTSECCVFVETEVAAPWTEDTVRQCLFLYLSLLPLNHRLVHELASVYTEAIADIKRSVLRAIEQPVSHCTVTVKTQN